MNTLEKTDLELKTTFKLVNDWNDKQNSFWLPAKHLALATTTLLLAIQELNNKIDGQPDGYEKSLKVCNQFMSEHAKSSNKNSAMGAYMIEFALSPLAEINKKIQGYPNNFDFVFEKVRKWSNDLSDSDKYLTTCKNSLSIILNVVEKLDNKTNVALVHNFTKKSSLKM